MRWDLGGDCWLMLHLHNYISTENPAEWNDGCLFGPSLSSLLQPPNPRGQATHEILSSTPFTRKTCQLLYIPSSHQKLQNISIVLSGVHTKPLGYRWEVLEKVIILSIIHQVSWHRDLFPHHVSQSQNSIIWINLKEFLHNLGVGSFMAFFIWGNGATNLCQFQVPMILC